MKMQGEQWILQIRERLCTHLDNGQGLRERGVVLKKMRFASLAIGIISLVSVYLITCQIRSVDINKSIEAPEKLRIEDLTNQLVNEKEKNADLIMQLVDLQRSLEEYRDEASSTGAVNKAMRSDLARAQILAGVTPLEGSGVTVTVSDSTIPTSEMSGNVEEYIIHDGDLRMILTELYGAGAEAVSVNGQRVVATTAVRCVGNTIMVNDVKIASPFEIRAIGDANTLEAALMIKGGVSDYLKSWSINVSVKKEERIEIPRYSGVVNFKYASVIAEESDVK